ncbi:serine/threonine-protein kinase [Microbacterium keratanolyticum]|uniref:non-specific serine/threonine protein kinase n=1 Tax=Microbacterium keratanolyticum TaxID=67574 RepID=A0A9W6HSL8_9MICO|nr:Stk1 family PASTA domain-containing Ser/Thr kinase [Microbacterium keratanolyticum]MBM7470063.1 serine/threonine-protein kinase [Microbacterium keratanolyticum]GLK02142.1 serine/threonine protein kinase [Microbacterium keratanolyticum]
MTINQQADPLIGRLVDGRYRVRARIARGGMATVYVATDLRLERRIALKVMHGHLSDDSVFQSRFIQEARAAARLADPNVVNVFDQGQDGDLAYLVMEYLPGITLRELMREQRRLSIPQTITIMDAILSGLAAAHSADIVHRDVKPENVLLAEDGRIKIGDFGLARATTANTATGQQLLGTIAYLAPELVTRGTADARSDIYALGIMLYEMLVGEQPYKGEQPMQIAFQHATESVPRPSVRNPGVPEQLDELVLWATEKSPDERPNNAQEMLDRLRVIERELGITPTVTTQTARSATSLVDSGDLTLVMPGTSTGAPTTAIDAGAAPLDNATLLRRRSAKRRARGGFLIALVLLLAAAAAGAGWWFGSGPGSLVAIADVAGSNYPDAAAVLTEQGFVPTEASENSLDVPVGVVIRTDPENGTRSDRGTAVTVFVSTGPAEQTVPPLNGKSEADAKAYLEGIGANVGESVALFSGAAEGLVINADVAPRAGGDQYPCGEGCTLFEGDTVVLLVSLGALPDVTGMTIDQAAKALGDKQLEVSDETVTEYSDEIKKDRVIRIADRSDGGNWRPGDAVTLVVSQGPQPIEVPDVEGMNLADAMALLQEQGFEPNTSVPQFIWGLFTATRTDPEDGTMLDRGAKVRVFASE